MSVNQTTAFEQTRPLSENPAAVYLASLSRGSRPTMKYSLNIIARILTGDRLDALSLDWSQLRYQHTLAIRSFLMERYQPATCNKMLSGMRMTLKHAWKLGQMTSEEYHQARDVATIRFTSVPTGRALLPAELLSLIQVCSADESPAGARDAAIISVMYQTGIHRPSVTSLTLDDYNRETGELRVNTKEHKKLITWITGDGKENLDAWLDLRGSEPGPLFCRILKDGKITYKSISPQSVYDVMCRRTGQAGIASAGPHDMQRTLTTTWLDDKDGTVQKMTGYASPAMIVLCDQRIKEVKRKAAAKLVVPTFSR